MADKDNRHGRKPESGARNSDYLREAPFDDPLGKTRAGISSIPPGYMLSHTYRIERLLQRGGMGEVYLAEHVALGTKHAIKVIHPNLFSDQNVLDLFHREATVLRGLRNEAVVSYEGFFRDENGRNFLVMEYVEGPSLSEVLKQGGLPVEQVFMLRDRLVDGLAAAHDKGAVHRDISPDNIILPNGRVDEAKLIDFGICKITDPGVQTIIGDSFAGKYRFASPEQLGLFGGKVDERSDIYSLGLVLAAATTGMPLGATNSLDTVLQKRKSVPDLTAVPLELRDQLSAMLQPSPDQRPESMAELMRDWPKPKTLETKLNRIQEMYPQSSRVTNSANMRKPATPSRHFKRIAAGVVGLVLICAGIYAVFVIIRDKGEKEPPPTKIPEQCQLPLEELVAMSWAKIEPCMQALMIRGRQDETFVLLEAAVRQGHTLPDAKTYQFAIDLRASGRTDKAFALFRQLARAGHGSSALVVGEMYDPVTWSKESSPFDKPNPRQAEKWYKRALSQGSDAAKTHLEKLRTWKQNQ